MAREVPGSPDHFETGYDAGAEPGAASTIEQQWLERTKPYRVVFRTTRTPEGFPHADAYVRVTSSFLLTSVGAAATRRSEEHTSELQSLMRISYAVFCLTTNTTHHSYIVDLIHT